MVRFIPLEFNNADVDDGGFIYTTTADKNSLSSVKRLNPSGIDVLRVNGEFAPVGDLTFNRSSFVDIKVSVMVSIVRWIQQEAGCSRITRMAICSMS